jgi:copper chaperone
VGFRADVILAVSGMSCQHCVNAVHDALVELPGVQDAQVDLDSGMVRVVGAGLDPAALRRVVEEAGYTTSAP